MPNRIIKESVCTSDNLDSLSWFEEAFFYRLLVNLDDYGRMDARPAILRSRLFPLKTVTDKQIEAALLSLRSADIIDIYVVDGRSYLQMRTWEKHQAIRAKRSKYPAPDEGLQANEIICKQMHADDCKCSRNPIQSNTNPNPNPNTNRERASAFSPPSVEDVKAYCDERQNGINAQHFVDHYSANGWMVGKNKMKDWKAAVRTWEQNDVNKKKSGNPFLEMLKEDANEPF